MSKATRFVKSIRGATMVEYALLIVAVMVLAASAYRVLGQTVQSNASKSSGVLGQ